MPVQPQVPLWQLFPPVQAFPQLPQFALSELVSVQVPSHMVCPSGQVHDPFVQICPSPQTFPQLPQLPASVCVSAHPPSQQDPKEPHSDVGPSGALVHCRSPLQN